MLFFYKIITYICGKKYMYMWEKLFIFREKKNVPNQLFFYKMKNENVFLLYIYLFVCLFVCLFVVC